jgi:HAD superfamily hydrolase (TIGR01509 family)
MADPDVDSRGTSGVISAVIFDMDGLLLDSEVYWERARRAYAASVGCAWSERDELDVKGMNSVEWAALIRDRCRLAADLSGIIAGVTARMRELYEEHLPLLPGALHAVRSTAAVYPLGLASSSPRDLIELVLTEARIRDDFSAVVSSDEVGKGKPNPEVFLETARRLGIHPDRIAVFEDSSAGIRAAHAAGMRVIVVPNPHFPPASDALGLAELVLSSLDNFSPDLLAEM